MRQITRIACWSTLVAWVVLPAGARGQTSSPQAKELIKEFDQDQDGKLGNAELERALQALFPQTREYVRVIKSEKGTPIALETSVASLESRDGEVQVDLLGAIHVADASYYRELNKRFRDYDVVLYELVAPEGTRVPRGGQKAQHPVGRMQQGIKGLLELAFQLDHIDYTRENLVHADMSPEEFSKSMKDRGESFVQILFRMMGQAAAKSSDQDRPSDFDLIRALFASDRALRLKRVMATQFQDIEAQMQVLEGPNGSTLVGERNKKALSVLRKEMEKGHKKIGIFYGAAHMPDISRRLQEDFGMRPTDEEWLKAWDMSTESR
ncbi:MAG: hypothetical protein P8N76_01290 [Pirellulaceae bacterium]|nr:hypothetical protein [Pirellulaceae bacterium]